MINGRIHYKWSFSIAMLNYQRVYTVIHINDFLRKPGEVLLGRDSRESNGNHVFCLFESTTLPEHEMI